jgi:hypothetical protein
MTIKNLASAGKTRDERGEGEGEGEGEVERITTKNESESMCLIFLRYNLNF